MKFDREMEETTKKTSMGKLAEKLNAAACCCTGEIKEFEIPTVFAFHNRP